MLRIKPFQGLRPAPEFAREVASVPYDVVDREEAAALVRDAPRNLLHVDRAEIDLPPETDPYSAAVYERARANFVALQRDGVLIRETAPCVYLYQQRMGNHAQTGIAAVCHIDDYENDIIRKHEKTRRDKEDDRTRLIDALSADTGPGFPDVSRSAVDQCADGTRVERAAALRFFRARWHSSYRLANSSCGGTGRRVSQCALRLCRGRTSSHGERRARRSRAARTQPAPYRCRRLQLVSRGVVSGQPAADSPVQSRGQRSQWDGAKKSSSAKRAKCFASAAAARPRRSAPERSRCIWTANGRHSNGQPSTDDPIAQLDVTALQDRLLAPMLGIDDPRTSKRIDFIGGIRGTGELERLVDSGRAAVAFSLFPTTVEQLMAIADAGRDHAAEEHVV